jgi:hypothetical protein
MAVRKTRKLEVFTLQCRNEDQPVDYTAFLRRIARTRPEARRMELGDKLVALPIARLTGDIVDFVAYEGPQGVSPLIFQARTGGERYGNLAVGEVMATRTHGVIDLIRREAIVEYNQRGAKASAIAEILEDTARRIGIGDLFTVELLARPDQSFLEALDRFGRIKVANMKVAEPNFDWKDNYENLNIVGDQSHGRTVELTVTANPRDSLSRDHGVVLYIRQMVNRGIANLKGARITGVRAGESADTTISLSNHIQHQKVYVAVDENGHVLSTDIRQKLHSFVEARRA